MTVARAARAGVWSAADIILRQVVGFAASIILARLLAPADFGLISLLVFFTSLSIVFVQGGLSLALIQRRETTPDQETAIFWANVCAAIFFALILIAIAPAVARFYGFPLMDPLMYVAAAQVVLSSFGAVQNALLTRTLRFDRLTKAGILSSLVSAFAGVGAAYAGWGIWALAAQILTQAAVNSAALWWVSDFRPGLRPRFSSIRDMVAFGTDISLSSILEVFYSNGFVLVIGKLYGAAELAFLNRAASIQGLPTGIISSIIARTALPLFAGRADDKDALLRGLRMSTRLATVLSLPLMAGLSVLADLVVLVLLGPKWTPAAPVLRIAAVAGAFLPIQILCLQLLLAVGGSRAYLRIEIEKKIAGVLCYGVGCFYGIIGMAYASLVFALLVLFINVRPTKTILAYGMFGLLRDSRDSIAVTLAMAAVVVALRQVLDLPRATLLAVLVAAGGISYVAIGLSLRLRNFTEALDIVRSLLPAASGKLRQVGNA